MNAIEENVLVGRLAGRLPRSPAQLNGLHEADAELIDLGPWSDRLLVLKVDAVVEEIESGLYDDPWLAGWMAVTSCLSDLAAVGADPLGVLLAVTLPAGASKQTTSRLSQGIAAACAQAGTYLLGGDTSTGARLSICGAAAGLVPRGAALTRLGARPGDRVWLTGPAGLGSAFALARLLGTGAPPPAFRPCARLAEGRLLRRLARCCIDTSDGVLAAVDTLMRLNRCRFVLHDRWPQVLHPAALAAVEAVGVPPWVALAGTHGEFELCFTVAPEREGALLQEAALAGFTPILLGEVTAGEGVFLRGADGDLELDTALIRNLGQQAANDPGAYLDALCACQDPLQKTLPTSM